MKIRRTPRALILAAALTAGLAFAGDAWAQGPLTAAFTYQGEVAWNGVTPSSTVDLRFRLFSEPTGGSPLAGTSTIENLGVALNNSRFTTTLDFGSGAFDGNQRFLEISVRSPAGVGSYVTLSPRQALSAGPHATFASKAGNATNLNGQAAAFYQNANNLNAGTIPDGRLAGTVARTNVNQTFTGAMTFSNAANVFTGSGAGLTGLNASNLGTGTIADARLSSNVALRNVENTFAQNNVFSTRLTTGGPAWGNYPSTLQVNNTAGTNQNGGLVINTSDAGAWPFLLFATNNQQRSYFEYKGPGGPFHYHVSGVGTPLTITNDGKVGINSVFAPTQALDVNGSIRSRGGDFILNGRGGGVGNNTNSGRALVDMGDGVSPNAVGLGLAINFGNDFGQVVVDSPLIANGNVRVGNGGFASPELAMGSGSAGFHRPMGLTTEEGALLNLDLNFRMGNKVQAERGGALRLDSRAGQPLFNFFGRDAGSATESLLMLIQPSGFVGINQSNPIGAAKFGVTGTTNSFAGIEVGTTGSGGIPYYGFHTGGTQRAWIEYDAGTNAINNRVGGQYLTQFQRSGSSNFLGLLGNVGINCNASSTAEVEIRGGAPGGNGNADLLFRPITTTGGLGRCINIAAASEASILTNPTFFIGHFDGFSTYSDRIIVNSSGSVTIPGALAKGGGSFKIDHPVDPENKYLYHSFVESPDMMNVYNGNVTTDNTGFATITLPDYFEALNSDFRYQLTVVDESEDTWTMVKVARKIQGNEFSIRTSTPNTEVSWQVTGIRKDAWAQKNRIPNAVDKEPENRGKYIHPEAFGLPEDRGIYTRKVDAAKVEAAGQQQAENRADRKD